MDFKYSILLQASNTIKKEKIVNFNESGFIGLSTSNAIEWNPYVLSDYVFQVLYTTSRLKYMKKVKIVNLNESGFIGLSMSNANEGNP